MSCTPFFYFSPSQDPFENLAIEQALLMNMQPDQMGLLLYINRPCVVLGRFQNPWYELNISSCLSNSVEVVRRQSGGGTVYHDLGNLNFCFLHGTRDYRQELNYLIVANALKNFQVETHIEGDTNLFVGDKKISGSAFKQKKDRSFHHGTLLVDSNLDDLNFYIQRTIEEIELLKGIKSRPRSVVNLHQLNSNITHLSLVHALRDEFQKICQSEVVELKEVGFDTDYLKFIKDEEWLWGETPLFQMKFNNLLYEVKKNVVLRVDGSSSHTHCGLKFNQLFNI